MSRSPIPLLLGFVVSGVLSGCKAQPFDGQIYEANDLRFRVGPVPSGWRQIDVTDSDSLLAFRDDSARATIALTGRCGRDGDDVPLRALTHHLFLHFTDRQVVSEERIKLDGRAALRTELLATLDGVPKRFVTVVLKKNECVYDFLYITDVAPGLDEGVATPNDREEFERFVAGFSTLRPR